MAAAFRQSACLAAVLLAGVQPAALGAMGAGAASEMLAYAARPEQGDRALQARRRIGGMIARIGAGAIDALAAEVAGDGEPAERALAAAYLGQLGWDPARYGMGDYPLELTGNPWGYEHLSPGRCASEAKRAIPALRKAASAEDEDLRRQARISLAVLALAHLASPSGYQHPKPVPVEALGPGDKALLGRLVWLRPSSGATEEQIADAIVRIDPEGTTAVTLLAPQCGREGSRAQAVLSRYPAKVVVPALELFVRMGTGGGGPPAEEPGTFMFLLRLAPESRTGAEAFGKLMARSTVLTRIGDLAREGFPGLTEPARTNLAMAIVSHLEVKDDDDARPVSPARS